MTILFMIIAAIIAIFFVVVIHEMGHLLAAKAVGVKVERFSIGFGKVLWSIKPKETEYAVSLLPLGGYVKMLGEESGPIPENEQHRAYNRKSVYARMFIVLAGPITNFILALILFWAIFLPGIYAVKPIIGKVQANSIAANAGLAPKDEIIKMNGTITPTWQRVFMVLVTKMGEKSFLDVTVQRNHVQTVHQLNLENWNVDPKNPDFWGSLGLSPFTPKIPPILNDVQKNSPAEKAGLQSHDRILSIDGKKIDDWMEVADIIQAHPNQKLNFAVQRGQQQLNLIVIPAAQKRDGKSVGFVGAIVKFPPLPPELLTQIHYNVLTAWSPAFQQVWTLSSFNAIVLYKMVIGNISPKNIGGPITVFRMAGQASQGGWIVYLGFMAFISVTLGFVNLLPIPGLDGGHFFFLLIEAIAGRPLPERIQVALFQLGLILLATLILYATFNDILRLL